MNESMRISGVLIDTSPLWCMSFSSKIPLSMASGTTHALVHYNSYWVEAKGSDEYNGTIQPILLPDEYTLEDVKTKVRGLIGFNQGPDFDIYGLLLVEATAKRQRFKINGEEPLSFYRMQATRVPSYFIVKTALCHPPITPERRQTIRSIEVESPLTPDSGGDCSKNETCNIGNTPIGSFNCSTPFHFGESCGLILHTSTNLDYVYLLQTVKSFQRLEDA